VRHRLSTLGAGLLVIVVGLFVLVGCLGAAGALARANKAVLAYAGIDLPPTHYPPTSGGFGIHLSQHLHIPRVGTYVRRLS